MLSLFGHSNVTTTHPEDRDVIGLAAMYDDRLLRLLLCPGKTVTKLANSAVTSLNDSERLDLSTIGVEIERVEITNADRNRIRSEALAAGKTDVEATFLASQAQGGFRSAKPIKITAHFKPGTGC